MFSSLIASRAASGTAGMLRSTLMPPNDLLRLGFDAGTGSTRTMGQHIHGVHTRESATIREVQLRPDQEVAISQVMLLPPKGEIIYGDHDVDSALHRNRALFDGKVIRRHKLGLHPEFRDIPDVVHMWGVISAEKDPWAIVDLFEDWLRALFNDARAAFKRPDLNTGRPDSYWDAIPLEIHISVPAIWSDRQRGMVRMAAQRAAKASGKSVKEPLIALREEALCVATQFLSRDSSAKVGSIYIFVDVGDGTLDITTVRVIRAHSTEAPMQLERVGICSGSGAGSSMINAAALAWVRETYKQELDLRLLQLGIKWPEFPRQLWEQIDAIKLIVDKPGIRRLRAIITSSHGRVGPGQLNDWTIEFPEEAIAQWYDTWTAAADQLLVQHLSTLNTERPMADVSAKVTGVSLAVPFADHSNILLK